MCSLKPPTIHCRWATQGKFAFLFYISKGIKDKTYRFSILMTQTGFIFSTLERCLALLPEILYFILLKPELNPYWTSGSKLHLRIHCWRLFGLFALILCKNKHICTWTTLQNIAQGINCQQISSSVLSSLIQPRKGKTFTINLNKEN